jgi:hypothetical protein
MDIVTTMMNSTELTWEQFLQCLEPYPIFGDMQIHVTHEADGGYKIRVVDHEVGAYNITEGKYDETEDMSCTVVIMNTDKAGKITVIQHGYNLFTPANKQHVIHTAHFIGKTIAGIEEHVEEEAQA